MNSTCTYITRLHDRIMELEKTIPLNERYDNQTFTSGRCAGLREAYDLLCQLILQDLTGNRTKEQQ